MFLKVRNFRDNKLERDRQRERKGGQTDSYFASFDTIQTCHCYN